MGLPAPLLSGCLFSSSLRAVSTAGNSALRGAGGRRPRDPWSPTSEHLSQVFGRRSVEGARSTSAGRVLTSHFGWHDRPHTSAGLWRSGGGGRPILTAGPCVSRRPVRSFPLFTQVSHVAWRSEAEPPWYSSRRS